jgi:hypothetical protein
MDAVAIAREACMAHSNGKQKNELDAFEFEFTDLDTARHALDELPAGVGHAQRQPDYWKQFRRVPLATDRLVVGTTREWLARLPAHVRPRVLIERYPRLVNLIAETWRSAQDCQQTFDDLIDDRRGGRRGFSFEIEVELRALRQYRAGLGRV